MAAYLLATLGGKSNPSKADVQEILESVGLDIDDEKLTKVSAERLFPSPRRGLLYETLRAGCQ